MSGAGFSAAGFSPGGFGDIDEAAAAPTDNMVDAKGQQQSARAIDPATGQYVLRASGRAEGMPRVRQLVLVRIRTVLNSSSVRGLGFAAPMGDNDSFAQRRLQGALEQALADLVRAQLIVLVSVALSSDVPTRLRGILKWRDLTTGQEFKETL